MYIEDAFDYSTLRSCLSPFMSGGVNCLYAKFDASVAGRPETTLNSQLISVQRPARGWCFRCPEAESAHACPSCGAETITRRRWPGANRSRHDTSTNHFWNIALGSVAWIPFV